MEKRCTQCLKFKHLDEFYKDSHSKDGRTSACKPCRSRQVSQARRKRSNRSNGLVVNESPRLLEHNLRTLENLLGASQEPKNMVLRTRIVEAIASHPQGIVIQDGTAYIETEGGRVSKDLKRCSILSLAQYLVLKKIRIESRENVNV